MPLLTLPIAMIALAALPALASIYWLRNRYRRQEVSSLLLWGGQREAREGGGRFSRLQTPLLLLLELLAILLLAVAAAGPRVQALAERQSIVVVLDGSYSMQAEHDPRGQAIEALRKQLASGGKYSAQLILADANPHLLGPPTTRPDETVEQAQGWDTHAGSADLAGAITMAYELGGPRAKILVLTDHPYPDELGAGQLQWWSFGEAKPNLAITSAVRNVAGEGERVMVEVTNLGTASAHTTLTFAGDQSRSFDIAAAASHRLWLDLRASDQPFVAQLPDDALAIDNRAVLLPQPRPSLRVGVAIDDDALQESVVRFVEHAKNATLVTDGEQLLITDRPTGVPASSAAWVLRVISEPQAEVSAYIGPFVVDRSHPLTVGTSFDRVIWSAGSDDALPGRPVVMVGNVPLVTEAPRALGREVRLRVRPDQSSLMQSPDFPILLWNLVDWQLGTLPGLRKTNYRLDSTARLGVAGTLEQVNVLPEDAAPRAVPVVSDGVQITADRVGLTQVQAGERSYTFAVNTMSYEESDLRAAGTSRAGSWLDEATVRDEYRSIAWLLLLLTLVLLGLHTALISRSGGLS
ncbi:MAG: VWA domain-containing protein [Planctomycetota bacterium]